MKIMVIIWVEIYTVMIAFKIRGIGENPPPTYQEIRCHMIFVIKMEDFLREAWYFARGHTNVAPPTLKYVSVVSRESFHIALTISAFDDLEVKTSNIQNAYLTAPCLEKIWTTLCSEFGPNLISKKALVVRDFYGFKSAGSSFRNCLAQCMRNLGYFFVPGRSIFINKEETRPSDGAKYYVYFLLYVDYCLVVHHAEDTPLHELDHFFKMKSG